MDMDNLTTPASDVCPRFQSNFKSRPIGVYFFAVYPIICAVAIVGNSLILATILSDRNQQRSVIQRRTFRLLTLVLCCCELVEATLLALLLVRLGVGYHNRQYGSGWDSSEWSSDSENEFYVRHVTLLRILFSARDVAIGVEIYVYSLLALDRLLAIVAPTSRRWNSRAVGFAVLAGLVVMTTGEVAMQTWRYNGLKEASDDAACNRLVVYTRINTFTKAGVGILAYMLSVGTYTATGGMLLGRARSVAPEGEQRAAAIEQARRPLLALVLGNVIQFASLLPMVLDNFSNGRMDACLYYLFFANSAAVPCLTVAFNRGLRRHLVRRLAFKSAAMATPPVTMVAPTGGS